MIEGSRQAADAHAIVPEDLAEEGRVRGLLAEVVPEIGSGAWRLLSWRAEGEVQVRPGAHLVFGRMSYEEAPNGRLRTDDVMLKVHEGDRGARTCEALGELWKAGFRPPGEHRVPRVYGYSPELGVLLQSRVVGEPWLDLLGGDVRELREVSRKAAGWLLRLQGSPVGAEGRESEEAPALAPKLARGYPRYAPRVTRLAERIAETSGTGAVTLVPSHGDYHPENVLLGTDAVTVVDLGNLGRRDAAYDVGYCVGQLLIRSYLGGGGFAPGARAADAFWGRYASEGPAAWPRVAAHAARAFLQGLHYELCILGSDRAGLLDVWPDLAERLLESDKSETLENIVRGR